MAGIISMVGIISVAVQALACNLTISWSMASGLTRLGTVEPKIV